MDYQSIEFITSSITHNFKVPFFVLFFVSATFFSLFYYSSFFNHIPQITKPTAHQLFLFLPVYLTGCGINLPWRVPRKQGCTNVGNTSC